MKWIVRLIDLVWRLLTGIRWRGNAAREQKDPGGEASGSAIAPYGEYHLRDKSQTTLVASSVEEELQAAARTDAPGNMSEQPQETLLDALETAGDSTLLLPLTDVPEARALPEEPAREPSSDRGNLAELTLFSDDEPTRTELVALAPETSEDTKPTEVAPVLVEVESAGDSETAGAPQAGELPEPEEPPVAAGDEQASADVSQGNMPPSEPNAKPIKIHVELFIASRLLAQESEVFTADELIAKAREQFGDRRRGVEILAKGPWLVANRPASGTAYNYLLRIEHAKLRCFDPSQDFAYPTRVRRPYQPQIGDVPESYRDLLSADLEAVQTEIAPPIIGPEHETDGPQTLAGWERRLRDRVARVALIADLNLSREETKALADLVAGLLRERGYARATADLERHYPHVFVCLLAFEGRYGYSSRVHAYWPTLCQAVGLARSAAMMRDWGSAFVGLIDSIGLRVPLDSDRYVDQILFQGGMPVSSLPGFFEHMLYPLLERPDWSGLSDRALIEQWIDSSTRYLVDQPIIRFLRFGDAVAEKIVAALRQMIGAMADEATAAPQDSGVPAYIVEAYELWRQRQGQEDQEPDPTIRLRSPHLALAPWSEGVHLVLPCQTVAQDLVSGAIFWRVLIGGKETIIRPEIARDRERCYVGAAVKPLARYADGCFVTLASDLEDIRQWEIDLAASAGSGFLAFDPDTGRLLDRGDLPERERVWLLLAPGTRLEESPKGAALICETLPLLPSDWVEWQGVEADLTTVSAITFHGSAGGQTLAVLSARSSQAHLVGGKRLDVEGAAPLYSGRPPDLWLNLDPQEEDLAALWLDVRSGPGSVPSLRFKATLERLRQHLIISGHTGEQIRGLHLALGANELLGDCSFGEYTVGVHSKLGDSSLRFRMVPFLEIEGNDRLLLPCHEQKPEDLFLRVLVDQATDVSIPDSFSLLGQEKCEAAHSFLLQIPDDPSAVSLPVALRRGRADSGREASMTISIPIRRLRWQLRMTGLRRNRPSWSDQAVAISMEELEQAHECCLVLDLSSARSMTRATLEIAAPGSVLQELSSESLGRQTRFRRFDLRRALATLHESAEGRITARLVVANLRQQETHRFVALTIHRGIRLQSIQARLTEKEGDSTLELLWEPDIRLRWRHIRLWPLARPWAPSVDVSVPDGCEGRYACPIEPDALADGLYRAELTVIDPWVSVMAPDAPEPEATNAIDLVIGRPCDRLVQLASASDQPVAEFCTLAEAFLLARLLGQDALEAALVERCMRQMHTAPLGVAIAMVVALGNHPKAPAMARQLFSAARIYDAIEGFSSGSLDERRFLSYLRLCPNPDKLSLPSLGALLDLPEGNLRYTAAGALLDRGQESAVLRVLDWLAERQLGLEDAVSLYGHNPTLAARTLSQMPTSGDVFRLLDRLGEAYPDSIIRIAPGQWVRTQAGWARIEEIRSGENQGLRWIWRERLGQDCQLHLTLRPGEKDEESLVLHPDGTLEFTQPLYDARRSHRFVCDKCDHFVSRVQDCIGTHDRECHEGRGRQLRPLRRPRMRQHAKLRFSINRPSTIWE